LKVSRLFLALRLPIPLRGTPDRGHASYDHVPAMCLPLRCRAARRCASSGVWDRRCGGRPTCRAGVDARSACSYSLRSRVLPLRTSLQKKRGGDAHAL